MENYPEFGHATLPFFAMEPGYANLNHGTAGGIPRRVEDASQDLAARIAANPDRFIWFHYRPMLEEVRGMVAKLIGADPSECVFVPNVSHGISVILRNFTWEEGDVIAITNCTFGTISAAARYVSDTPPHPKLSKFVLSFPETRASILERFREYLKNLKAEQRRSASGISKGKIVAVLDTISATPSVYMPWKEMVQICREESVWSVIDAAHSLGQEVDINLTEAAPDFWVSSSSKWMYTKYGCALLYVPKRNHHIIKSAFPTSITYGAHLHGGQDDLQSKFFWTGTLDFTIPLSIKPALEFRSFLGGEKRINQYCRALALAGGKRLAEILNTRTMFSADSDEAEALTANMINVEIPLASSIAPTSAVTLMFQDKLLNQHNVYASQFYYDGRWWTRASAQVYNEISDFEKLGNALLIVCAEVTKEVAERAQI
ncbi:PLP-dependent transferase [Laetiporus sulphureus 93-53]|uniref:PLP-dependent transferase n=1 Tax=Laetiporus sulphureus 93-53 TaxID=1314785 RepID=A0A165EBE6_9APHY|nr:PLP-dependent transferase [Laetiporus sulphureus 93-53]KZT06655.1 PLP-dependent transferase [Laetiporus sulphureus 93-53]